MDKVTIHKITGKTASGLCYETEDVVIEQAAGMLVVAPNGYEYLVSTNEDGSINVSAGCFNHQTKEFVDFHKISLTTDGKGVTMHPVENK